MSRKGPHKRSKIPASVLASAGRHGLGTPVASAPVHGEEGAPNSPEGGVVASTSSPASVRPRPQAPSLHFISTPPPPPVDSDEVEHDEISREAAREAVRDEASMPPVDVDAHFFDAPIDASDEPEHRDPRHARKLTATAAKRRAHLARYVTVAVGLSSALCVAALVKIAVARNHEDGRPRSSWGGQAAAAAVPLNAEPPREPAPSSAPAANSVPADTTAANAAPLPVGEPPSTPPPSAVPETPSAQVAASPQPSQLAVADTAPSTVPSGVPPAAAPANIPPAAAPADVPPATSLDPKEATKAAAKEKVKSQRALEWGKFGDAVAAGERSVALDPTDAEAWLLLGAAYQQKGDSKNAVRSFRSCVDQGKRGPRYDCAAMLR